MGDRRPTAPQLTASPELTPIPTLVHTRPTTLEITGTFSLPQSPQSHRRVLHLTRRHWAAACLMD